MIAKPHWRILKDSVVQWVEDQPFQLAAALSYYTLFSLAPLLIIVISIAGFVFGRDAAQNRIVETIQGLVGQDSAAAIQAIIQNANSNPGSGILSTVLGVLILLIGAGGVVGQLQTSLNTIWGVTPNRPRDLGFYTRTLHFIWLDLSDRISPLGIASRKRLPHSTESIRREFFRRHGIGRPRIGPRGFADVCDGAFCDDLQNPARR